MEADNTAPAAEEAAPSEEAAPQEAEQITEESGDVTVPLNEKASRKEEAIAKLRAALAAEGDKPEVEEDPVGKLTAEALENPFSVSKEQFEALPDDAKKLVANLRALTTKRTQQVAEERKRLQAEREALTSGKFMEDLKTRSEAEVGFDPFDPDSVQAHIDKQVAASLRQALEPVRQEVELSNRRAQLERFKADNPDINQPEVKADVVKLLKSDENLTLERAYAIVQGNRALHEREQLRAELLRVRGEAKKAGLKIGGASRATGSNRVPAAVRAQGGWAVAQWLQAHGK